YTNCGHCYNIIYNPVPLCLFDEKEALEELCPSRLRLQFSVEDRQETRQVLLECRRVFLEGKEPAWQGKSFTRGHFRRGIL
ncbi:MAG: U32 family peptidase, partial [Ruminococcus sp.]|nr:U32 family peptidase [Ruminococcus sp.]